MGGAQQSISVRRPNACAKVLNLFGGICRSGGTASGSSRLKSKEVTSTESGLFGKVHLRDEPREQRRHFSGIQLRVDSKPSHSVYECSSADTQSDCSAIRTAYAALACGKRLYDFLALLPFVLVSAGVDIRS